MSNNQEKEKKQLGIDISAEQDDNEEKQQNDAVIDQTFTEEVGENTSPDHTLLTDDNGDSTLVSIESEMKRCYLEYAMSVIVSRAIPDVRDGCKPVQRRILYTLYKMAGQKRNYFKSARVVGDTMGKYHPHGDSPIYGALVRMAQTFSLSAPLIDGQGNFGSVDGDSPAQMRYTEVRLHKLSHSLLEDLEFETVDFQENYDGSEQEPKYLAARFPNILVNGSNGIAVGMATNIPPFNLGEVIEGCCAYIDNPAITTAEMIKIIPAPDFPTGGEIVGVDKLNNAMYKGQGIITLRGKVEVENEGGRSSIVITEIPYQVNKSDMVKNIELASREKHIDGIVDIRDESNKLGIRVVIVLRRDAEPEVVLNQIYKHSQLESSFGINMLVLKEGKPQMMNFLEIISYFVKFRQEIVTKRTKFLLGKARDRTHLLVGIMVAIQNIDPIIKIVKENHDPAGARARLISVPWLVNPHTAEMIQSIADPRNMLYSHDDKLLIEGVDPLPSSPGYYVYLTASQADSILEMRIQRLTGVEIEKIDKELYELIKNITYYIDILQSPAKLLNVIREELVDIKERYSVPRRTGIVAVANDINEEDLIKQESMVVTITRTGYIKRTPLVSYREQKRGGKGKSAMSTHDDDVVTDVIVTTTHHSIMLFSDMGKVYRIKVYKLPLGAPHSKGRSLVNLIPLASGEKISSVLTISSECLNSSTIDEDLNEEELVNNTDFSDSEESTNPNAKSNPVDIKNNNSENPLPASNDEEKEEGEYNSENDADDNSQNLNDDNYYLIFATAKGNARRNLLSDFRNIPTNGKIAIKLNDDKLIGVVLCRANDHVMLATKYGKAIRFSVNAIRVFKGRTSSGVRAVRLMKGSDAVVSLSALAGMIVTSEERESFLRLPISKRIELHDLLIKKEHLSEDELNDVKKEIEKLVKNMEQVSEDKLSHELIIKMAKSEEFILTVTENGFAKRSSCYEYRLTGRGGQGVSNIETSRRNGLVVAAFPVQQNDGIMAVTDKGSMIRVSVESIRSSSRNTLGVKVMNLQKNDIVSSVSKIIEEDRALEISTEEEII